MIFIHRVTGEIALREFQLCALSRSNVIESAMENIKFIYSRMGYDYVGEF